MAPAEHLSDVLQVPYILGRDFFIFSEYSSDFFRPVRFEADRKEIGLTIRPCTRCQGIPASGAFFVYVLALVRTKYNIDSNLLEVYE